MTHWRAGVLAFSMVLLGILASGCQLVDRFNDPYVSNNTGAPLAISYIHNGQTIPLGVTANVGVLAPLSLFRDECTDGTLLAI